MGRLTHSVTTVSESEKPAELRKAALALLARAAFGHLSLVLADVRVGLRLLGLAFFLGGRGPVCVVRLLGFGALGVPRRLIRSGSFVAHALAVPLDVAPVTS